MQSASSWIISVNRSGSAVGLRIAKVRSWGKLPGPGCDASPTLHPLNGLKSVSIEIEFVGFSACDMSRGLHETLARDQGKWSKTARSVILLARLALSLVG